VADGIGVVDQPTVPVLALMAVAVLALVVVNLAAVEPARRARRIPPAAILRTG
jgi:ABC-type lipoprotein release transport system permease subunit